MSFDFISSLLTLLGVGVLVCLFTLGKKWLTRHIDRSVDYYYNEKLAEFKSDLATASQLKLQQLEQAHLVSNEAFIHGHRIAAEQRIRAATTLWRAVVNLDRTRPSALMDLDKLSPDSYDLMRTDSTYRKSIDEIVVYSLDSVREVLKQDDVDEMRPFIGENCYELYRVYRGLIYGIGMILKFDVSSDKPVQCWFNHPTIRRALSSVLSEEELETFGEKEKGRISWVLQVIEEKILADVDKIVKGDFSIDEGVAQANRIRSEIYQEPLESLVEAVISESVS